MGPSIYISEGVFKFIITISLLGSSLATIFLIVSWIKESINKSVW